MTIPGPTTLTSNSATSVQRPYVDVTFANAKSVVIVTGGYRGIRRAPCERFVKSGAAVVCADGDRDIARRGRSARTVRSTVRTSCTPGSGP